MFLSIYLTIYILYVYLYHVYILIENVMPKNKK